MKSKFTVLVIAALLFVACDKNDTEKTIYDLSFEKTEYNITNRLENPMFVDPLTQKRFDP